MLLRPLSRCETFCTGPDGFRLPQFPTLWPEFNNSISRRSKGESELRSSAHDLARVRVLNESLLPFAVAFDQRSLLAKRGQRAYQGIPNPYGPAFDYDGARHYIAKHAARRFEDHGRSGVKIPNHFPRNLRRLHADHFRPPEIGDGGEGELFPGKRTFEFRRRTE